MKAVAFSIIAFLSLSSASYAYTAKQAIPFRCSSGATIGVILATDVGISAYNSPTRPRYYCRWSIVAPIGGRMWIEGATREADPFESACRDDQTAEVVACVNEFNATCVYQEENPADKVQMFGKSKASIRPECYPPRTKN